MQKKSRSASPLNSINRRHFLKAAGAAIILPAILPGSVLGRGGKAPPSGKIVMGVVGWGGQGSGDAAIVNRERRLPIRRRLRR